jgi:hypothetical protein
MLSRIILALVAALAIAPALAGETATPPPFDAGKYPAEVQKALRYANEECTRQGGGAVTFAPDTVRTLDLTGDGRDDYVIQFGDVRCAERAAVYCGSGGCLINILVALPNGRVRKVFDDYVRSYEIRPAPAGNATGAHGQIRTPRQLLRRPRLVALHQGTARHDGAVRVQNAQLTAARRALPKPVRWR